MKRALIFSLCSLSLLAGSASAQQSPMQKPTDVKIEAHVYEPVMLDVTDDLIS